MDAVSQAVLSEEKGDYGDKPVPEEKEVSQETCTHTGAALEVAAAAGEDGTTTTGE